MNILRKSDGASSIAVAIWSVVVIVVAIGAIVLVKLNAGTASNSAATTAAPAALVAKITSLDASVFQKVGMGSATKLPSVISGGTAYTKDNKPAILYIGAEYCPYCAAERWAMVTALSRFGTFTGLGSTSSSSSDTYPSTATFSFHGATYTSQYLSFTGVEETTNQLDSSTGSYAKLDTPTSDEQALLTKYDAAPYVAASSAGSIPFIYFGGQYLMVGSNYDPSLLQGKTHDQIADALKDPSTDISKGIIGAANTITATLCKLTNNAPANVCSTSAITTLEGKLGS